MKRLLLLRHAKAVSGTDPLADIARPLADRGEHDAHRIGERLQHQRLRPDLILASPATRTVQTAELVAAALDYPRDAIALERSLYLAEPATLGSVIAMQNAAIECLLIVGHNPGLTELIHELLPSFAVDDLPTGAIAALDYPGVAYWSEIAGTTPRLAYYDFPKNPSPPLMPR